MRAFDPLPPVISFLGRTTLQRSQSLDVVQRAPGDEPIAAIVALIWHGHSDRSPDVAALGIGPQRGIYDDMNTAVDKGGEGLSQRLRCRR